MTKNKPILYALKFALIAAFSCLIIIFIGLYMSNRKASEQSSSASYSFSGVTLIIDAGHGGEDAGAVAVDGTLEKDLNLQISNLLCALFELNGTAVRMTRTSDTLLYDYYGDLNDYTGQKKVYDLKNRLKIAMEYENPVFVSIHMNKFSIEKYSGMQIYYSASSEQSQSIARTIQEYNKSYLQKENNRQIKRADSSIYVLDKISAPAVLIECGFLSNQNELSLLKNEDYQASLALVLFSSVSNFT